MPTLAKNAAVLLARVRTVLPARSPYSVFVGCSYSIEPAALRLSLTPTLTLCVKDPSTDADRIGGNQDEGDHAGHDAAIDPIVDRAALHQHVAGFQMYRGVVEHHVDLAGHDDGVV